MANVKDLIKNLTSNPVEWDSLLLAQKLQPILEELANGEGGGGNIIETDWDFTKWENTDPGVYSAMFASLEEAGLSGLSDGSVICIPRTVEENLVQKEYMRLATKETYIGDEADEVTMVFNNIEVIQDMSNFWLQVKVAQGFNKSGELFAVGVEVTTPIMN